MTTKELLALDGRWRERSGDPMYHSAAQAAYFVCADELAPIAAALCAEVEALNKVLDAARRVYVDRDADGGESVDALFAAIAAIDAAKEPK